MLDDKDIQKLSSILATKADMQEIRKEFKADIQEVRQDLESNFLVLKSDIEDVKKDVEGLRESIQGMMVAVDNLAKVISDLRLEYAAISTQLTRHERWIKQIAEKVGLNLAME
ncbi:MAG: hypothetical protein UU10_C0016G0008 [Parcubacteria group bacterium GW2011_GWF1_40_6]|uniref:Uncharacterized protein n=2 Tax=Candidatus Nomuraibacteriota TaxID=1752729 RepID=A0A0G0QT32_9BACT|nr:MAG: hypothetical protein UT78_C0005G0067 [Candidatus Nomurabacteria bacterium GW2011_GWF2_40_12]KKR69002.1 MAG: hypothetical protein UU10_C0016G0008 [Parcubacteria group bacterium GW2011_GWF1_40_6]OGJ09031.1 MAG: hypothetical protein A2356_01445 [Candidatus Nomurabacteria bacterium RIFOXYB1_FULL_39_16]OGJ14682.1 MAG: hypothetical protein A2585_02335 [Candidatus Nomurabacteria bacterium RIFOXYD1_FULL_39_12]